MPEAFNLMNRHNIILRMKVAIYLRSEKLSNWLFGDIEDWDVSKVTNMNNLFQGKGCKADLIKWNIANIKSVDFFWPKIESFPTFFTDENISKWNIE